MAAAVCRFFAEDGVQHFIGRLREAGVSMEAAEQAPKGTALAGKKFVITGTLPGVTRDQAGELIRQHGGEVASSVSKKTSFLLAGEEAGSKLQKAESLGVPILSWEMLLQMLGE